MIEQREGNGCAQRRRPDGFNDDANLPIVDQDFVIGSNNGAIRQRRNTDNFTFCRREGSLYNRVFTDKSLFVVLHRPLHLQLNRMTAEIGIDTFIPAHILDAHCALVIKTASF